MFVLVFRFSMSACASDRVPYFPYIHLSWLLSFLVLIFFILRGFTTKFKGGDRLSFGVLSSFWGDGSTCQKLGFSFAFSLVPGCGTGDSFEFYLWALCKICLRSFSGCHRCIWAVKLCPGVAVFWDSLPVILLDLGVVCEHTTWLRKLSFGCNNGS